MIKIVFMIKIVHLISLNKKHSLECFRDLFEIRHSRFSLAIHGHFRNWHQIFYDTSGMCKIYVLSIFDFLVYRFHGNIDFLEKRTQLNFNVFSKTGVFFTSIRSREGW